MCNKTQDFVHLHVHSHFSLQDALPTPEKLAMKAREEGYQAIALTDHGKMGGCVELVDACRKSVDNLPTIKPIIGCEFYTVADRFDKTKKIKSDGSTARRANHLTLLAQNQKGYENLLELTYHASHPDVFHFTPRIDWDILSKHSEGIIALSGCLASEVNQALLEDNYEEAKDIAAKFKEAFGERYFIELQYHGIPEQKLVLPKLMQISKELDIKVVASNDVHYLDAQDWKLHDTLIQMRDLRDDKAIKSGGKKEAYGTHQFYLKDYNHMMQIFGKNAPEAVTNSVLIADMIEDFMKLDVPHLLPEARINDSSDEFMRFWKGNFPYHEQKEAYLAYLSFSGLRAMELDNNKTYVKRLRYELETIFNMGVVDYFLIQKEIVSFMQGAKIRYGLRGSAAGSLVNYCLNVSTIDPIPFELMFERFLNPGRGTQYKIDLECYPFKDWIAKHKLEDQQSYAIALKKLAKKFIEEKDCPELETKIMKEIWVLENQNFAQYFVDVAKQGHKQATNDCQLWIPYILGITAKKPDSEMIISKYATLPDIDTDIDDRKREQVITWTKERFGEENVMSVGTWGTYGAKNAVLSVLKTSENFIKKFPHNTHEMALKVTSTIPSNPPKITIKEALEESQEFYDWYKKYPAEIKTANKLLGTNSNLGVHASALMVSRQPIYKSTPVELSKSGDKSSDNGKKTFCTAYSMTNAERVGLIKYDFLGSKTYTAIDLALEIIKARTGDDIDIDTIPFDDKSVYNKVYKTGNAQSIFQCGEPGMQKALSTVKCESIHDLIAVISLYRPGPKKYIPTFATNKRNKEKVEYAHELIKKHLEKTYGIMIYQEQAMFLARDMANFTWQETEKLRKGISKKIGKEFDAAVNSFKEKSLAKGVAEPVVDNVIETMKEFGSYAFNIAHAVCYAKESYQTAWLRTHYPAEWFAACIQVYRQREDKVAIYLNECRTDHIAVKSPNVNESREIVTVTKSGEIIMPLNTIKGVGKIADSIVENQPYHELKDLIYKAKPNKGIIVNLAEAGALECLEDCRELDGDQVLELWQDITSNKNKEEKKQKALEKKLSISTPITKKIQESKKIGSVPSISKPKRNGDSVKHLFEGFE